VTRETRKGRSRAAAIKPPSSLAGLVRRHDSDRYLTALFAPPGRRDALFALYAFNYEVARVRESVTQPMLGQIRLQWWREVIAAAYECQPARRHEVVQPLVAAIEKFGLSRAHFDRLIDAREQDLGDEPPPTMAALEDYAEATSGGLLLLTLEILGVAGPAAERAAREIGIAYALAGLLRALPFQARTGRSCIPSDIAAAAGLASQLNPSARAGPALQYTIRFLADAAATHLRVARSLRREVPRAALPALLPAVVAGHWLARMKHAGWNPFDPSLARPDPLLPWRLALAKLRGTY
jgi:phytoene synthase